MKSSRLISIGLFIALSLGAGLSYQQLSKYSSSHDWTNNQRFSLSQSSKELLDTLDSELIIEVFVSQGALQNNIFRYLQLYKEQSGFISLKNINPAEQLDIIRTYDIRAEGTMRLSYKDKATFIDDELSEARILKALRKIQPHSRYQLVFTNGRGERSIVKTDAAGYGKIAQQLKNQALSLSTSTLDRAIPPSTHALVIASPLEAFDDIHLQKIQQFLAKGGSLLLLLDPETAGIHQTFLGKLGIQVAPGQLVDAAGSEVGLTDPGILYLPALPANSIQKTQMQILLPRSAALIADKSWHVLAATSPSSWNEISSLNSGKIAKDADSEIAGPWPIAFYQQSEAGRVIVVTDSDFASNAYLDTLDNNQWIQRIIQWLAAGSDINLPQHLASDAQLKLQPRHAGIAGFILMFALPGAFLLIAFRQKKRYA